MLVDRVLARLSRVTSGGALIMEIDGLRFFAIMSVVLFHLSGYFQHFTRVAFSTPLAESLLVQILGQGHYGVQLFFVISGFVLALPFAEQYTKRRVMPNLRKYFLRRLTRLEPPYLINLLIVFVLQVLVKNVAFSDLLPHLFASAGYLHNAVYGTGSAVNGVAWSLEVEVQFYILAPLINSVFLIRRVWLRRALLLVVAGIFAWLFRSPAFFIFLPGQIQYFLMGSLLADVFLTDWKRRPSKSFGWDMLASAAWLGILLVAIFGKLVEMALPLLILCAYIGSFRGRIWNRIVTNRWLVVIGGACYTTYLYHYLIISFLGRFSLRLSVGHSYEANYLLQLVLVVPAVLVACAVLFALLERPFMQRDWPARLKDRLARALPERAEPEA